MLCLLIALLALAGCGGDPDPSLELVALPTQAARPLLQFGPQGCPDALLEGILVRHGDAGFAVQGDPPAPPYIVVWPHGYVGRNLNGVRQLLDGNGAVLAREGDFVRAGGGYFPPDDRFIPCGPIEFAAGNG